MKQPGRKAYLSVTMSSTAPNVDVCLYFRASLPSVSSATKLQIAYLVSSQEQSALAPKIHHNCSGAYSKAMNSLGSWAKAGLPAPTQESIKWQRPMDIAAPIEKLSGYWLFLRNLQKQGQLNRLLNEAVAEQSSKVFFNSEC